MTTDLSIIFNNIIYSSMIGRSEYMSWEEKVRKVEPYVAGEQPKEKNIIKLNTNE